MPEYPRGDAAGRIPMNNQMRQRLQSAQTNDIVNILRSNIMITPDEADRAAREIEEIRAEAERLRKRLREAARDGHYEVAPPYSQKRNTYRKPNYWSDEHTPDRDNFWQKAAETVENDIVKELQVYAHEIWDDGDAHNLISRAIVEITYLRQRLERLDLPY